MPGYSPINNIYLFYMLNLCGKAINIERNKITIKSINQYKFSHYIQKPRNSLDLNIVKAILLTLDKQK